MTELLHASAYGHVDRVRQLIQNGADLSASDNSGRSALFWAATGGHVETVVHLINSGADVDQADGGRTPLMGAAANGYKAVCVALLLSGANPNLLNDEGMTALMCVPFPPLICATRARVFIPSLTVSFQPGTALLPCSSSHARTLAAGGLPSTISSRSSRSFSRSHPWQPPSRGGPPPPACPAPAGGPSSMSQMSRAARR